MIRLFPEAEPSKIGEIFMERFMKKIDLSLLPALLLGESASWAALLPSVASAQNLWGDAGTQTTTNYNLGADRSNSPAGASSARG